MVRPTIGRDTSTIDLRGGDRYDRSDMETYVRSYQETSVMTSLPAPSDALAESQRLIAALEQLRAELPLADDILTQYRPTHDELASSHVKSAL